MKLYANYTIELKEIDLRTEEFPYGDSPFFIAKVQRDAVQARVAGETLRECLEKLIVFLENHP